MEYLSYEDKMKLLASVFEKKIKEIDSLPPEEAQKVARQELINIGYLDKDGNIAAPYAAMRAEWEEEQKRE